MSLLMILSIFSLFVLSLMGKSCEFYIRRSCKIKRSRMTTRRPSFRSNLGLAATVFEEDLGRHVLESPADQIHFLGEQHFLENLPEPEVDHLDLQILRVDNNILQFDISMHNILPLQIIKRLQQLHKNRPRHAFLESLRLLSSVTRRGNIQLVY